MPRHESLTIDALLSEEHLGKSIAQNYIAVAGHFSFLCPFPGTMKNTGFLPATDHEGFDREDFHQQLRQEILDFLNEEFKVNQVQQNNQSQIHR